MQKNAHRPTRQAARCSTGAHHENTPSASRQKSPTATSGIGIARTAGIFARLLGLLLALQACTTDRPLSEAALLTPHVSEPEPNRATSAPSHAPGLLGARGGGEAGASIVADVPAQPTQGPQSPTSASARSCGKAVHITELMINPKAVPDELGEYVELFNASAESIDLRGWRLDNARRQPHEFTGEGPIWLPAGDALVFAKSADPDENGGVAAAGELGKLTLPNQGGVLRLYDPCGALIERVRYQAQPPWPKLSKGGAIARRSLECSADDPGCWAVPKSRIASGEKGSPGTVPPGVSSHVANSKPPPESFSSAETAPALHNSLRSVSEGSIAEDP